MSPILGAGLISGVGGLLGGLLGIGAQSSANSTNMELAKYAFDRNLDMWNKQNEYNAPAAQMERLKAAGLNPNLVYGSGSVVGNTSGSAPEYKAPTVNPVSNGGFISNAVQHAMFSGAQLRQINAQTEYTKTQSSVADAQIAKVSADTAETLQRTARSKFDLGLAEDLRQNSIDVANANLNSIRQNTELSKVRTSLEKVNLELKPLERSLTESQINRIKAETSRLIWDLNLEKQGRIPNNGSLLSWLVNQVIRAKNGEPSVLDGNSGIDKAFEAFKNLIPFMK